MESELPVSAAPARHRSDRRAVLSGAARVAGMLAALGLLPGAARALGETPPPEAAFHTHGSAAALQALGIAAPSPSTAVSVVAPEVAENGAVVPVTIACSLPGVRRLLLLVDENPAALAAMFDVGDAVVPSFALRVKMGDSSRVVAVALMADGRTLYAARDVKVTLGGCTE